MSEMPLVTIGVASYNNAGYLAETLDSTIQENYANREVIIVDDCSTDESVQVAREWIARHPDLAVTLIVNEVNKGVCRVLNQIVNASKGVFISTVGSDDIFLPNKLATQVPLLAGSTEAGMLFSDISKIDSSGQIIVPSVFATKQIFPSEGDVWIPLLKSNFIPAMTILIRKSCFESVGLFDESLAYEDWDMWLRLSRKFKVIYQPAVTALYRVHGGSATYQRQRQMNESTCTLLQKQLGVSPEGDAIIREHLVRYSETLYFLKSPRTGYWLRERWQYQKDIRGFILLAFSSLRVPAAWVSNVMRLIRRKTEDN